MLCYLCNLKRFLFKRLMVFINKLQMQNSKIKEELILGLSIEMESKIDQKLNLVYQQCVLVQSISFMFSFMTNKFIKKINLAQIHSKIIQEFMNLSLNVILIILISYFLEGLNPYHSLLFYFSILIYSFYYFLCIKNKKSQNFHKFIILSILRLLFHRF